MYLNTMGSAVVIWPIYLMTATSWVCVFPMGSINTVKPLGHAGGTPYGTHGPLLCVQTGYTRLSG